MLETTPGNQPTLERLFSIELLSNTSAASTLFIFLSYLTNRLYFRAVSIIGHSAGAHLTISALDRETVTLPTINLVKSIYLVTGIYDLRVLINSSVNENNKLTLDESNVEQLSPMLFDYTYLRGHKLKIYVIAAEYESPLFIEQSEGMNKQLEKFNIDSQYKFISGVDHLDILEQLGKNDFELTQLLLEELN